MAGGSSIVKSQCTVTSSHGWTVEIEILQTEAIPEFTDCPWHYHYEVGYNYNVTFTGSPNNREFHANIYFDCTGGFGSDPYADFGTFTGTTSGSGATANKARQYEVINSTAYDYGSEPDCNEVGLADINCTLVQIDYWGEGITSGTIFCATGFALPIELKKFTARKEGDFAALEWITETETNNEHFTIEKSRDGIVWEELGKIEGAINSSVPISYQYTDRTPHKGRNYYRLKQTDIDGSTTYSNTKTVLFDPPVKLAVYPIPASGDIHITADEPIREIHVLNRIGHQMIRSVTNGQQHSTIDVSRLATGIYFVTVYLESRTEVRKIIIQNEGQVEETD